MSRKKNQKSKRVPLSREELLSQAAMKSRIDKVQRTASKGEPAPAPVADETAAQALRPREFPGAELPTGDALLLTVSDLCGLLKISRTTLFRLEKSGQIPGRVSVCGQVRYHRETVEAWLRSLVKG